MQFERDSKDSSTQFWNFKTYIKFPFDEVPRTAKFDCF